MTAASGLVSNISAVERKLTEEFGYSEAILFGRARSAIAALLEVLRLSSDSEVLIPSNVCPSLYWSALSSRGRARLLPVEATSGLVDDVKQAEAIAGAKKGVVIATQLYGYRQPLPATIQAARKNGWFVLENDTSLTSAKSVAGNVSRAADALLVSFGYSKTIDVGGGGAIFTNDSALAKQLRSRAESYPPLDAAAQRKETLLMQRLREVRNAHGASPATGDELISQGQRELRYGFPEELLPLLRGSLSKLAETAGHRRERARAWAGKLDTLSDAIVVPPGAAVVPWRFIRRITRGRDAVVKALRAAGFDAGTNYPPLNDVHPGIEGESFSPGSIQWGREVINLWVTEDYDMARIDAAARIIAAALAGQA